MKVYKEMNNWWYLGIFVICIGMSFGTTYGADSGLPWWALIVALIFAWMFVPIIGTVSLRDVEYKAELIEFLALLHCRLCAIHREYGADAGWCSCTRQACRKHVLHLVSVDTCPFRTLNLLDIQATVTTPLFKLWPS